LGSPWELLESHYTASACACSCYHLTPDSCKLGQCVAEAETILLRSTSRGERGDLGQWKRPNILVSHPDRDRCCECVSTKYLQWNCDALLEPDPTIVMASCAHNVYESLHKRYLKDTPKPQPKRLDSRLLHRIIEDLSSRIKLSLQSSSIVFDGENFLKSKTGRLRARYLRAHNELSRNGVRLKGDSLISAFVKLERYFEEGKSPRMIMGRNPRFNILYAQIIEPIEKAFFKLEQVANACDNLSCGKKFEKLVGQWFMENDMSKFEGSQRLFTLRMEYMVYCLVFPEKVDLIDILFAYKIRKKGTTQTGVNFEFYECRGSGDMDTSLGNGILNYIATQYFLIKNYCPSCNFESCGNPQCKTYSFVVKGDDSYASIPRTSQYVNTYEFFGFDAKILIRTTPESVEFCSGKFLEYQPGKYIYVQKLKKMLQSITSCLNADAIRNGWVQHYYASLGKMYSVLYEGIPVYSEIGKMLSRIGGSHRLNVNLIQSYNLIEAFRSDHSEKIGYVDQPLAFVSCAMINSMDIGEINSIIEWCRTVKVTFDPRFQKRCNIKSSKTECPKIDYDELNAQITTEQMPKQVTKYYRKLRSFRSNWSTQS